MAKQQIKIVYLINSLNLGGAETMLIRLLQKIDLSLYNPVVVTLLDNDDRLTNIAKKYNIPVISMRMKAKTDILSILLLCRTLKHINPTILHTQLFAADILGRVMGRFLKIPVIITSIRNIYYGGYWRELMIKWTEQFAYKTTIVSKAAADRFIERNIIPADKLQVIYNGLDPRQFYSSVTRIKKKRIRSEMELPADGFLILCVGSLTGQKGYPTLFKALQLIQISDQNFYLAIAGEGPLEAQLKSIVEQSGLENRVIFLGCSEKVPELMAAADLFILSSHWEGMPGVVMEAMASELPVVATAVGGTAELVDNGNTGYLVSPDSPEELAESLLKVINMTEQERTKLGKAGRKRIEKHFHVDKMVKAYEDLYRICLLEKNLL